MYFTDSSNTNDKNDITHRATTDLPAYIDSYDNFNGEGLNDSDVVGGAEMILMIDNAPENSQLSETNLFIAVVENIDSKTIVFLIIILICVAVYSCKYYDKDLKDCVFNIYMS